MSPLNLMAQQKGITDSRPRSPFLPSFGKFFSRTSARSLATQWAFLRQTPLEDPNIVSVPKILHTVLKALQVVHRRGIGPSTRWFGVVRTRFEGGLQRRKCLCETVGGQVEAV